ncbi:helix-turn-helix transcriptional regulator [Massilia sp. R2A-15]|uniref:helix-turn-helix domain-containing protein n=1 Tax=Massilia sp. R2A-15 TaxID=3064278 RepID=UPI0027367E02|nr:helix-turn-helix transcriptional regulator [Massilia sp. R2A-15]WLI91564.1 helix-turn-helix transcriptional regulator [Massilia sp. R2A-15]
MDHDNNLQPVTNEFTYAANDACAAPVRVHEEIGLRQLRISKRESQATFWARFGVTQSSGSRFETGLGVPPPVALLIRLYTSGKLSDGDLLA